MSSKSGTASVRALSGCLTILGAGSLFSTTVESCIVLLATEMHYPNFCAESSASNAAVPDYAQPQEDEIKK
jgi:hypothetical protein